jgi:hypothetical protein
MFWFYYNFNADPRIGALDGISDVLHLLRRDSIPEEFCPHPSKNEGGCRALPMTDMRHKSVSGTVGFAGNCWVTSIELYC